MKIINEYLPLSEICAQENKKPIIILLLTPILLVTWKYYGTKSFYLTNLSDTFSFFGSPVMASEWYTYFSAFFLLGLISIAVVKFVFKETLNDYGISLGNWKEWLPVSLVIGVVMILLSWASSKNPQFIAEYPLYKGAGDSIWMFIIHAFVYMVFYFGWEIFFRGFMQFGLTPRFGITGAIFVQTAISCIIHIGKPDAEIYSSIIGGLVWGIMVYRYKTILPAVFTHWLLGVSLDFFICFT